MRDTLLLDVASFADAKQGAAVTLAALASYTEDAAGQFMSERATAKLAVLMIQGNLCNTVLIPVTGSTRNTVPVYLPFRFVPTERYPPPAVEP